MRTKLQKIDKLRATFTGTFVRCGIKNGYKGPQRTILIKDIKNSHGEIVTDHLWFNLTKGFESIELTEGITLKFNARVTEYQKGYKGWNEHKAMESPLQTDYKLSYPTKIQIIKNDLIIRD